MRHLALLLLISACGSKSSGETTSAAKTEVRVDKRLELVAIVEYLAGNRGYSPQAKVYMHDVDVVFGKFKDDPAVRDARALFGKGVGFEKPLHYALCLDDAFVPRCDTSQFDWYKPEVANDLAAWAKDLAAFAKTTDADTFFKNHDGYYKLVADKVAAAVDAEHPRDWFEQTYGPVTGATFWIAPGLVEGNWSFSLHVQQADHLELVAVLGADKIDDKNLPIVGDAALATLVHEMAHSYVNPVLAAHAKELAEPMAALLAHVQPQMKRAAYPTWPVFANEQVVRATTVLYLRDRKSAQAAADATRDEQRRGFLWTSDLADVLAKARKGNTHTLEAYVPALVESVTKLAASGVPPLPFYGPIDRIWDDASPQVLVGAPDDKEVARELLHVKSRVSATGVQLGARSFDGPHLVLVFAVPRPDDPTHGVAVYTAADAGDLAGATDQLRPGTDWLVARADGGKLAVIAQGDFPHAIDGAWLPAH